LIHSLGSAMSGGQMKSFAESFPGFDVAQAEPDAMSDDAMFAKVKALNAIFGGEEDD